MSTLNFCCFCISLEKGVKILGVFTLITTVILGGFVGIVAGTTPLLNRGTPHLEPLEVPWSFVIPYSILSVAMIIAASFLIAGVNKRRTNYLIPYLAVEGLRCFLYAWFLVEGLIDNKNASDNAKRIMLAVVVILILQLYFWLCAYSLFQRIFKERNSLPIVQQYVQVQQPPYHPQVAYAPVQKV